MSLPIWLGILFCISQSAIFSGLNLAFFSVSRLRLQVEVSMGNRAAVKVAEMRNDSNFLLTTILWGNVSINVLLTILSNSVMAGVSAFLFSTVVITFLGEIAPQAYFSRNALRMASSLAPVLRFYQIILFPVAKTTALVLDWWLGIEGIPYFREREFHHVLKAHIEADEADVDRLEGLGALNFLALDDLIVKEFGEPVNPSSIISLAFHDERPVFPKFENKTSDPFLQKIQASGEKWVILTDTTGKPRLALDADGFLRDALFNPAPSTMFTHCHKPIIVNDPRVHLGYFISQFTVQPQHRDDDVVDKDIILVWSDIKRVITGADVLGRLLRGILRKERM
ncbi:DUF21 domain-containing protein [candidate division CSSED10-310 bacterium]|uniref:DUF21 domain-containing protein n=1 Tax=candidate division CSSED10-310 bacterium TaxID=2855610 RepID=A0ABV6Z418_UNCC1